MTDVLRFAGDYRFLSNFYMRPVNYEGHTWPSVEHAYQAAKTDDSADKVEILHARTPGEAKRQGRRVQLHPNWERIKDEIMLELLREKFSDPWLGRLLMETRGFLIEGNSWHDNYWGICYCNTCPGEGRNKLGRSLMKVRKGLRVETGHG